MFYFFFNIMALSKTIVEVVGIVILSCRMKSKWDRRSTFFTEVSSTDMWFGLLYTPSGPGKSASYDDTDPLFCFCLIIQQSLFLQMKANSANDWTVIPTALLQCSFIRKSLHPNYRWCSGCREHRSDETTVTAQSFCTDNPGLSWLYSKAVCFHTSSYM